MKVFVARPVVAGGSGFCAATPGELMRFASTNECLVGCESHKGSTALLVEEMPAEQALTIYTKSLVSAGFFSSETLAEGEAHKMLREIKRVIGDCPVGTKFWTKGSQRSIAFNVLT